MGLLFGSASDGSFAQAALVEVLKTMSARVVQGAIANIPGARVKFDAAGKLKDVGTSDELRSVIHALAARSVKV